MKKLFTFVSIAILVSSCLKTLSSNEFEKRLQKVHQSWFSGLLNEDSQVIDKILSDDITLGFPRGNIMPRQDFIDALKNGTLYYDSAYHEYSKIRIYGNTGVINGRSNLTVRVKMENGEFYKVLEKLTYTAVYVLDKSSKIKMVAWQSTARPNE